MDVVGVVTPLVRGDAQVLHGDQVVELSVQRDAQEREERRTEKDKSKLKMREVNSKRDAHVHG